MTRTRGLMAGLCVAAWGMAAPVQAGIGGNCTLFFDKASFDQFNADTNKFLKGIENFEESNVPDGGKVPLPGPLVGNVPNVDALGIGFPNGLTEKNLIIQDNITPGPNPPTVNPSGSPNALYAIGTGFINANSKKAGEDLEVLNGIEASLDLIFTDDDNHTGVGFELSFFQGFPVTFWHITVYNKAGAEIAKATVQGTTEPDKAFFGIWCEESIGRINIWDEGITPDAVDNIQMWEDGQVPTCPWDCGDPHNKVVDVLDLLRVLAEYDTTNPPCDGGGQCDFDGNGCVDVTDLLKLLAVYGTICPPPVNDECANKTIIDRVATDGIIIEHFDAYGATPSPEPYKCIPDPPSHKDIWYCLQNNTNFQKGVIVSSSVDLLIEVNQGCQCFPNGGPLIACGFGLGGTPQFIMLPGEQVCIRLINELDLPNDVLKGDLIIENLPVGCGPATRIDFGVTPDDFGAANPCPGPIPITTQYVLTNSIVFGTAVDNFSPPGVVITDDTACFPSCRSSGLPTFTGDWWCQFRIGLAPGLPGALAGTTSFSAELCFIDSPPGTVLMEAYNNSRVLIASALNTVNGSEVLTVTAPAGDLIAYVRVVSSATPRGGGLSIDCLSYPDPVPRTPDQVNFFTDPADFFDAAGQAGKVAKLQWDFKPDFLGPGAIVPISDPLDITTHPNNAFGVWFDSLGNNLWPPEVDNVQFWANVTPLGPFTPNGVPGALGYAKLDNNVLYASDPPNGFTIFSGPPAGPDVNHTALVVELAGFRDDGITLPPIFNVAVYDKADNVMGTFVVSVDPAQSCPWDLNGDGVIDVTDVQILQANFGPCPLPCPPCLGDFDGNCVVDVADLTKLQGQVGLACPVPKAFLGILTKDPAITIGRVDIWDENGGLEGISYIEAYLQPQTNPFGCPQPGDCCVPHPNPGCDNQDCCRRVCNIDPYCCDVPPQGGFWDQLCADEALQFPQCNCGGPPVHDIDPCLPPNCPPDVDPVWCVYDIINVVQGDPGICADRGIFVGGRICVTPCPFPGDLIDCDPDGTGVVRFRTVGNNCVFDAVPKDGCEPCPPGTTQWTRIN